eukprot:3134401-Alexandrium_andersonii.AAC.1
MPDDWVPYEWMTFAGKGRRERPSCCARLPMRIGRGGAPSAWRSSSASTTHASTDCAVCRGTSWMLWCTRRT